MKASLHRPLLLCALLPIILLAACGDDGGDDDDDDDDDVTVDAATDHDAPAGDPDAAAVDGTTGDASSSIVQVVTCPGEVDATVTTPGFEFDVTPDATIPVDGIVHFDLGGGHNAQSGEPGAATEDFLVGFGGDVCLKFTQAGSYPFFCVPHLFTGSLTVE